MSAETELENRLTRLEGGVARSIELGEETVELQTAANGRTRKLEEAVTKHFHDHETKDSYNQGLATGKASLGNVDLAKISALVAGLATLMSGLFAAVTK